MIVGRNEDDNSSLLYYFETQQTSASAILEPDDFAGPVVMLTGPSDEEKIRIAGSLLLRYSKDVENSAPVLLSTEAGTRLPHTAVLDDQDLSTARLVTA